jgi:tetratricopeptide (TPR) repeat protein
VHLYYDYDFVEAETRFRRALALQPGLAMTHYWYAGLLSATGRHEEAIARIRAAQELDPLSPLINADAGWYYFYARR